MADPGCPFCTIELERVVGAWGPVFAIRDAFPVSEGHTLIIPRRHVATLFELDEAEWSAVRGALHDLKAQLSESLPRRPAGWNVGVNVGEAGGQTVGHVHVHLIPRYDGDVPDPRGGVRHVIPGKGKAPR